MRKENINISKEEQKILTKGVDKNTEKEQILNEVLFNKTLNYLYNLASENV
jgi:hypothetical protein